MKLTKEDIAINRQVAKRIGSWGWIDGKQPSRQFDIRERALGMTGSRVGFISAAKVLCCPQF